VTGTTVEALARAQAELERLCARVQGQVGVAAWLVAAPERVLAVRADELFPTASTFKIPLLYALYQMVERGEVTLADRVRIDPSHRVPGSGVLQDLDPGLEPTIRDLAVLMTVVSDNQATDMLYGIVGTERLHGALDSLGLRRTRIPMPTRALLYDYVGLDPTNPEHTYEEALQRMRDRQYNLAGVAWSDQEGSGNDLTTPREMAAMCAAIEQGVGLSEASREGVIDIMKRQKFSDRIPAGVPEGVSIAHKTGSLKGVRNDAGIVYGHQGPYVIALFSKRLEDEKAGVDTLGALSKVVWNVLGEGA
jgi:beta-lactamase class A